MQPPQTPPLAIFSRVVRNRQAELIVDCSSQGSRSGRAGTLADDELDNRLAQRGARKAMVKSSTQRTFDRREQRRLVIYGKACNEKKGPTNRVSEMEKPWSKQINLARRRILGAKGIMKRLDD